VHAAISVPGMPDEIPPEYVPRDADGDGHGVRARVTAAAERGGFVLLTGGSSVGKTRYAAEAEQALAYAATWLHGAAAALAPAGAGMGSAAPGISASVFRYRAAPLDSQAET
jgi:hypothetical protein